MTRALLAGALALALPSIAAAQDPMTAASPPATLEGRVDDFALIAPVATQSVETPFVGTFTLAGGARGTLSVSRQEDTLGFSATLSGGDARLAAKVSEPGPWRLPLAGPTRGLIRRLDGQAAQTADEKSDAGVLVLTHDGKGGLTAVVEKDGRKTAVTVTRKKEALVVYGTYETGMRVYAQQCSAYYRAKGYQVTEQPGDWPGVVGALFSAEQDGHTFGRVVIVSHGGWDGPMFGPRMSQLSATSDPESFGHLVRAFRRGTTLDAKLIFSACHSGGSNRFEKDHSDYRYTDDLAARTGRFAYGVNGSTSTEWSRELCQLAEGEGPARQESRISSPGGGKTVMPGRGAGRPAIANQSLGGDD